jgi:1-acyl-sn-glycerol-3-phosphate acyltransferase
MDNLGFIPVRKKGKTVETICEHLNKLKKFTFAISPEGSVARNPIFKSGFYHIAKNTGAKICILNLDFQNHTIVYHEPWEPADTLEEEKARVKKFFSLHPPLYPEETDYAEHYFPIRHQLMSCRWEQVLGFLLMIFIIYQFAKPRL